MHPLLLEWRRLLVYLAGWALLGGLLVPLLLLAAPFGWLEAALFAVPMAILLGLMGLGSFWVCQAAPLARGLDRAIGTQFLTGLVSAWLWLGAGRAWAYALQRALGFGDTVGNQGRAAPVLLALGLTLYLLTAATHYAVAASESSRDAERRALQLEVSSREAELRALRAQIHPHFLFNSLNSINALIASRPEEARRLCVTLADFLRRSLTLGAREAIPLAEELELVEQLMAIEKVRFGDRLGHEVRADEAARACLVPPLLLQPLIENAVTHGIAQRLEGGTITVIAERRGDELQVAIENPRDPDAPARKGAGIGLQNVRRRLSALHPERSSLRLLPQADRFRVELRLPALA
ncbi:MAG TPA: histidine kinase [Vicinamibacteria bacterium]|nr:histidine kinase [Vicinamibacteria bacterium]